MIMQRCSFREFALLFKPIDTQATFGIKLFKQPGSDTCLCFYEQVFLHLFFSCNMIYSFKNTHHQARDVRSTKI